MEGAGYPDVRLRRLRRTEALRDMFAMPKPGPEKFIWPVFVVPGTGRREPIASMPGQFRLSADELVKELAPVVAQGVKSVLLFGQHEGGGKDECGTPAELWASGIKNVPSALPNGSIPFLTMQRIWYDAIECGDKRYELRKQSEKYRKWFIEQHPAAVKLQRGYTNCQMTWEVNGTEDCGADGIVIHLGKRIV